jgi:chemotaxis protein MotB
MFIALFAMSTVDVTKFKAFAVGFHEALGGGKLDASIGGSGKATSPVVGEGNGNGPFSGGTLMPSQGSVDSKTLASILTALATGSQAKQKQQQTLDQVAKQIENAAKSLGLGGKVQTKQRNNGLEVTLLTDKVLFDSGAADVRVEGQPLLQAVEAVLHDITNPILIYGYTDDRPIATGQFKSNLYLSGARAAAVAEYFIGRGLDAHRLTAAGRGALDPIASNATPEGRAQNRRVEIIVQSKLVKETLERAGVDDKVTTPTTTPIAPPVAGHEGAKPDLSPALGAH